MGFRKSTHYKLIFEDPEYAGLEVTMRSLSLGELMDMGTAEAHAEDDPKTQLANSEKMYRTFADKLVEWNLEDEDGNPVPATYEGVREQELGFVLTIINSWMANTSSVPKGLENASSDGLSSLELSIPMEVS